MRKSSLRQVSVALALVTSLSLAATACGGTTTVLTMETVHDTDAVFDAIAATGLRAIVGKCLMDVSGETPARLYQATRDAIDESLDLHRRWSGAADGRLGAALAPRFALSCTREMLEAVADVSAREGLLIHTHASEQRDDLSFGRGQRHVMQRQRLVVRSPHAMERNPAHRAPARVRSMLRASSTMGARPARKMSKAGAAASSRRSSLAKE